MHKFGHKHEYRGSDWPQPVGVPGRQRYTVLTWRRWFDFLWYKPYDYRTTVFIDRECKYTTLKFYPYQEDRGQIMVDGEDLFGILENMAVRGRVYVQCDAVNEAVIRRPRQLTDADCYGVWLHFTDKKSAMMAKLALG